MAEGMNWPQRLLAAQEALLAAEKRAEELEGENERLRSVLKTLSNPGNRDELESAAIAPATLAPAEEPG